MTRCFVVGTDTGVGKTHVACALLQALALHHTGARTAPVHGPAGGRIRQPNTVRTITGHHGLRRVPKAVAVTGLNPAPARARGLQQLRAV